jgi:PD-(D/E)XK nuclease superfamily
VSLVYRTMFQNWIRKADPDGYLTKDVVQALLTGDAPQVQELLEQILLTAMSFQDPAGRAPEKLYHGFILGLLVHMESLYDVRSNRESGRGRADVFMRPKIPGQPGVVMEFKVPLGKETPEQAIVKAATQVRNRRYATELVAAGASPVYEYAMVFDGKQAWVKLVADVLATPTT